jgi:DNA-directed RNA polymerase subunit RPC12/RpoP
LKKAVLVESERVRMETFSCPQCGASLESGHIEGSTVECPYCHSAVIVPPELRPAPTPTPAPPLRDYAADEASKKGLSFVGKMALIIGGKLFFVFLGVMFKPENDPKPHSYQPQSVLPQLPTKPSPTPTPYVFSFGGEGTGPGLFQDAQEVAVSK